MKNFHSIKIILIVFLINIIEPKFIVAQDSWTVTTLDNPAPGYLRFDDPLYPNFFLLDNYGLKQYVDSNSHMVPTYCKLLSNGLWISGGADKYYLFTQDMKLKDSIPYPMPSLYSTDFHESEFLSNGHYLILCIEKIGINMSNIVQGGQKVAQINSNVLVETDPSGKIYWQWKAIDHLKITDVTPDIDLTQPVIEFTHVNSFAEDIDGNIIISFRHLDEITKINKESGQIMWRLGGSKCKNNQFTFINDSNNDNNGFVGFSHQHSISLLPNNNILMYDNGDLKKYAYSRAVEYHVDDSLYTVTKVWEYRNNPDIYQRLEGSVYRMPNGNTLINWGKSKITEVRPNKSIAFELTYNNIIYSYRARRLVTSMNAVSKTINGTGDYDFNDSNYTTGVNVAVTSLTGSGLTAIEKHNYAPPTGDYKDSNFSFIYPYRWVFSQNGISNMSGTFKINANAIENISNPAQVSVYQRDKETLGTFRELKTVFDSSKNEISADFTGFGEFTVGSKVLAVPGLISPVNFNENTPVDGWMTWSKINGAEYYQLQLSTSLDFVGNLFYFDIVSIPKFYYQNLSNNTKYYWRVRCFNSKNISPWSDIYTFTTELLNSVMVNNNILNKSYLFYPNPVFDRIQFWDNSLTGLKYKIINLGGKTLSEGTIKNENINVDFLIPGIYFIITENSIFKFIKK